MPAIKLVGLTKGFTARRGRKPNSVFESLDWALPVVAGGEFISIMGTSGGGKTTLLNLISGLIHPDHGEIKLFGKVVRGPTGYSVMMPQAYTCFPWLTVLRNVEFGLKLKGVPRSERVILSTEYIERVGLGANLQSYPSELSGGMQQRVSIARTLAVRRPLVLMDEPFGALDARTRADMQELLLSLWTVEKSLILFVTHDVQEAVYLADRIIVLPKPPIRAITEDIKVPFPRPRDPKLKASLAFLQFVGSVTSRLDDVARGDREL